MAVGRKPTWLKPQVRTPALHALPIIAHATDIDQYRLDRTLTPKQQQFITMMQISQMIVGVGVAVFYILKLRSGEQCAVDKELLIACGIM